MKVIVLGAGLVGGPMAADLTGDKDLDVTLADINEKALKRWSSDALRVIHKDLSYPADVTELVKEYDLVVSAVPGHLGYQTLEAVIEGERNVVDITFAAEDPLSLNSLAGRKNVTAIVDCGVAPGMSHLLTGYAHSRLERTEKVRIYVGGLPRKRVLPFQYKAVFSPSDVIEEYTRPARLVIGGKTVERPALSDVENLEFSPVGTLEAFNSDGLRTLTRTIPCPDMREKTLRYPGHAALMTFLRESGFFSTDPVDVQGTPVRPMDVTSRILFPHWRFEEGEEDLTIMKVVVEGILNQRKHRTTFDLYDEFDPRRGVHSMARTTGFTATTAVRWLRNHPQVPAGILPPEELGKDPDTARFFLRELKSKGVIYRETEQSL